MSSCTSMAKLQYGASIITSPLMGSFSSEDVLWSFVHSPHSVSPASSLQSNAQGQQRSEHRKARAERSTATWICHTGICYWAGVAFGVTILELLHYPESRISFPHASVQGLAWLSLKCIRIKNLIKWQSCFSGGKWGEIVKCHMTFTYLFIFAFRRATKLP